MDLELLERPVDRSQWLADYPGKVTVTLLVVVHECKTDELRPEVAKLIRDALVDDNKQCYRDLVGVVGEPLGHVYRVCQNLKVQLYVAHKERQG